MILIKYNILFPQLCLSLFPTTDTPLHKRALKGRRRLNSAARARTGRHSFALAASKADLTGWPKKRFAVLARSLLDAWLRGEGQRKRFSRCRIISWPLPAQ